MIYTATIANRELAELSYPLLGIQQATNNNPEVIALLQSRFPDHVFKLLGGYATDLFIIRGGELSVAGGGFHPPNAVLTVVRSFADSHTMQLGWMRASDHAEALFTALKRTGHRTGENGFIFFSKGGILLVALPLPGNHHNRLFLQIDKTGSRVQAGYQSLLAEHGIGCVEVEPAEIPYRVRH